MSAASGSALDWLYGTQLFGIKLGLENVHRLLDALELPGQGMRFIHVAGTNGKGSTCAFMHAILREAGVDTGLFTSPHLVRFNERIQDHQRMISDREIEAGLSRIRVLVQDWQPHPTFFEITFALALDWFRQRGVGWVILETGMGGRLDATNAIHPAVAVITSIGWDHMEFLGNTLAQIAAEKAGIIKSEIPVITQAQPEEAGQILAAEAARLRAPLSVVPPWPGGPPGLPGPHQRQNAALAIQALCAAGISLGGEQIERGLATVVWPGRFQKISGFILDGAHNPEAARTLVQTWLEQYPGEKAVLTFGAASNKDIASMLAILAPIVGEWHFTAFQSPRSFSPAALRATWENLGEPTVPVRVFDSVGEALAYPADGLRLVAGSLYLVGEAIAVLSGQESKYRLTAQ